MDEAGGMKQPSSRLEILAIHRAGDRARNAKWDLDITIFLFAVLILVIILTTYTKMGIEIVAPIAIFGLAMVWLTGWRRGKQLYQRFYDEEIAELKQTPSKEAATLEEQLTSREIQVLHYVAQGYANKLIASELGISENTIKNFMSRVLAKLNANDRTDAVVIAIKLGLISVS